MMRDYSKVSPSLWESSRFNSLQTDDAKLAYLYLLTNSHQNMAGAYRLPMGYACSDLRWKPEKYGNALKELIQGDLVMYDSETEVIAIARWFRHNPPVSDNHMTGIERLLERLPSQSIASAVLEAAQESRGAFEADKAARASRKSKAAAAPSNGLGEGVPSRLQTPYMAGSRAR